MEIASLLVNILLEVRAKISQAGISPVMTYGSEAWSLTGKLEEIVTSSDHRMLRYRAAFRWQNGLLNEELRRRLDWKISDCG